MQGNSRFSAWEPPPSEEAILEARAKDKADLERLQKDVAPLFEKAECFRDQPTVTAGVVMDFLHYEVSPLMQRAAHNWRTTPQRVQSIGTGSGGANEGVAEGLL